MKSGEQIEDMLLSIQIKYYVLSTFQTTFTRLGL
jgi:hypothetical protein